MKALSVRQPWAELIMLGWKPWENRSWWHSYRGQLIIHASKKVDDDAGFFLLEHDLVLPDPVTCGAILGTVDLHRCERIEKLKDPGIYAFGPYCWGMKDPKRLAQPIPYMGKLGLFEVTEPSILEQLQA